MVLYHPLWWQSSLLATYKWFGYTGPIFYSQTRPLLQYRCPVAECEGSIVSHSNDAVEHLHVLCDAVNIGWRCQVAFDVRNFSVVAFRLMTAGLLHGQLWAFHCSLSSVDFSVHLVNNVGHFIVHLCRCKLTIIAACQQTLAPGLISIALMVREKFCMLQSQCGSVA